MGTCQLSMENFSGSAHELIPGGLTVVKGDLKPKPEACLVKEGRILFIRIFFFPAVLFRVHILLIEDYRYLFNSTRCWLNLNDIDSFEIKIQATRKRLNPLDSVKAYIFMMLKFPSQTKGWDRRRGLILLCWGNSTSRISAGLWINIFRDDKNPTAVSLMQHPINPAYTGF